MAITVHTTGQQGFKALVYSQPSQSLIDYIGENVSAALAATNRFSQSFMEDIASIYHKFGSEASVRESKLLLNQIGSAFQDDAIYRVPLDGFGNVNLMMQHYIMANPFISNLHKKGMCHGFADTYINYENDTYGEESRLYQAVMDGVHDVENDKLVFYHHTGMNDDGTSLSVTDKMSVLDTWENVLTTALSGIDPTDPDGGSL